MGSTTMYASSSAITGLNGAFSDAGAILVIAIAATLAGGVALLGLGFAWRHLKHYITGRKF